MPSWNDLLSYVGIVPPVQNGLGPPVQPVWNANNPVGTEGLGEQSLSMPAGNLDPVVGYWPTGKPMTRSEYQGIQDTSLNLFSQASQMIGNNLAAGEGRAVVGAARQPVPMERAAPQTAPLGAGPEVWEPKPYGVEQIPLRRQAWQPNEHQWSIKDPGGADAGKIYTTWDPETGNLHIEDIQSQEGPNTLGLTAIRQVRSALLDQYPEVKTLSGLRISGATYAHKNSGSGPGRPAMQTVRNQGGSE
jgi:hypothetical protein